MQVIIRRLGTTGLMLVAFATFAAQAQATTAPIATTGSATAITAQGATLIGSVSTSGLTTAWQFQYGTTTTYGATTPVKAIGAGQGILSVAAPVLALKPNTVYHFRLVVTAPGSAYYTSPIVGADATFTTTKIGTLAIGPGTLKIKKKATTASLQCKSTVACVGKLALTLSIKVSRRKTVIYTCASAKFSVAASKAGSLSLKASNQCIKLLKQAQHKTLTGKLSVGEAYVPSTGSQP